MSWDLWAHLVLKTTGSYYLFCSSARFVYSSAYSGTSFSISARTELIHSFYILCYMDYMVIPQFTQPVPCCWTIRSFTTKMEQTDFQAFTVSLRWLPRSGIAGWNDVSTFDFVDINYYPLKRLYQYLLPHQT